MENHGTCFDKLIGWAIFIVIVQIVSSTIVYHKLHKEIWAQYFKTNEAQEKIHNVDIHYGNVTPRPAKSPISAQ